MHACASVTALAVLCLPHQCGRQRTCLPDCKRVFCAVVASGAASWHHRTGPAQNHHVNCAVAAAAAACHVFCTAVHCRCGADGSYQQPILCLVGNLSASSGARGDDATRLLLTWREFRTLLHEMGHAVHSLVSRTRYQHVWGTRWVGGRVGGVRGETWAYLPSLIWGVIQNLNPSQQLSG